MIASGVTPFRLAYRLTGAIVTTSIAIAQNAAAQVISIEAGTATMQQASGATVRFWTDRSEGWIGAGAADGARLGAFVATRFGEGRSRVELGDNTLSLRLPTDAAGSAAQFVVRGAGVSGASGGTNWRAFAGSTAESFATRFFTSARSDRPLLWFELDRPVSARLSFSSRTAISDRTTVLHALRWSPGPGADASVAAGIGAGELYVAANGGFIRQRVSARASWIEAGDGFRRQVAAQPMQTEAVGINANVTVRPGAGFVVSAARQNFIAIPEHDEPGARASVAMLATAWRRRSFRAGINAHRASVPGGISGGASATVAADRLGRFSGSLMLWRSSPAIGSASSGFVANVGAHVTRNIEFLQVLSGTRGQVTASAGGRIVTNPVRASIEYQTIFTPAAAGTLFRQAMVLNAQVQPGGSLKFDLGTQILPDGRVRYYAKAATFVYPGGGAPRASGSRFRMPARLIRGRVIDEQGEAVSGAAIRIGDELVFTDSRGTFFIRTTRTSALDIQVEPDEFLARGRWELVHAPIRVVPADPMSAEPVTITVRRTAPSR